MDIKKEYIICFIVLVVVAYIFYKLGQKSEGFDPNLQWSPFRNSDMNRSYEMGHNIAYDTAQLNYESQKDPCMKVDKRHILAEQPVREPEPQLDLQTRWVPMQYTDLQELQLNEGERDERLGLDGLQDSNEIRELNGLYNINNVPVKEPYAIGPENQIDNDSTIQELPMNLGQGENYNQAIRQMINNVINQNPGVQQYPNMQQGSSMFGNWSLILLVVIIIIGLIWYFSSRKTVVIQ